MKSAMWRETYSRLMEVTGVQRLTAQTGQDSRHTERRYQPAWSGQSTLEKA